MISVFYCDSKAFSALDQWWDLNRWLLRSKCFLLEASWTTGSFFVERSFINVRAQRTNQEGVLLHFYGILFWLAYGFPKKPAFPPQDKASWIRSRRFGVATTFETPQFWILQSPCVIRSLVISWSWCCWLPRRRLRWINSRFFVGHVLSAPPNQKKDAPQMGVDLLTKWLGPVNPKQTLRWSPSGFFFPWFSYEAGKKKLKQKGGENFGWYIFMFKSCHLELEIGTIFWGGSAKGHTPET